MKTYNTELLLKFLTRAITYLYKKDGTKPGLVISYLPASSAYYVSVVRYNPKTVVFSTEGCDIGVALITAARWVSDQEEYENPIQKLSNFLAQ